MTYKIKVAFLIDTLISDRAGSEKQLIGIINRLDRNQFDATLICLYESPWMFRNQIPCDVISLGYQGFINPNFPSVIWRYQKLLKEKSIDVVQTFFEDSLIIGCLAKLLSRNKYSLIVSRRDLGLGLDEPMYHYLYKKIKPFILKSVNGVATNSNAIKAHLTTIENIPSEKIKVIANGLNMPEPPRMIPALFNDYQADIWIGVVANLKPIKRIDLFLRAMAHLSPKCSGKKVRAVILGEGRLKTELVKLAMELGIGGRVHFMGTVANVSDYLWFTDIGVLCSDNEGLSNAVLEYMACGLPVIATDVGGNSELVAEANGVCVPAGNHLALADALKKLISSATLRKKMGNKSLKNVTSYFTWDKIMPQWETYYRSMTVQSK